MASSLPDSPSLDRLRDHARRLQRGVRSEDPEALSFLREWHPRPDHTPVETLPLHDAQLAVARRYGFAGWPALTAYVETARGLSRNPSEVAEDDLDPADAVCALGCLRYDEEDAPPRWARAAALLDQDPALVARSIWTAATAADPGAVRRHLERDPALARRPGGPHRWEPLLYVCYSRVQQHQEGDALVVVRMLLDAGADPDAGYLWRGLATPFTALTGVFGEGEQGPGRQPRHPHSLALAGLLLDRGAEANDGQTLYNRMFTPGTEHLELLFRYGLGGPDRGPWRGRLGDALESPAEMLDRQVHWAADHGFTDRLALFERQGVDITGVEVRDPSILPADVNAKAGGRTPLHEAAWDGDIGRIERLLAAGADPTARDDEYGTRPLEWAEYAYQHAAADLLRGVTPGGTDQVGQTR